VVSLEGFALRLAGDEQVSLCMPCEVGRGFTVNGGELRPFADDLERVLRELDVLWVRKELADPARGAGCGGELVSWVRLDHVDADLGTRQLEMEGGGAADDAATDDESIRVRDHRVSSSLRG
jgi:hypothetical protein